MDSGSGFGGALANDAIDEAVVIKFDGGWTACGE